MNRVPGARYTKEFREEAVKLVEAVGASEPSRRLSFPLKSLANWQRAAKAGKREEVGRQQKPQTELEAEIQAAHRRTRETCGPERLQKELAAHGLQVGLHRIRRLRKKLGLRCKQKRKFKATTDLKH
ncbi:MAG TPA: IS3 family transposase, partial [Noviherbaspirillum sp.]